MSCFSVVVFGASGEEEGAGGDEEGAGGDEVLEGDRGLGVFVASGLDEGLALDEGWAEDEGDGEAGAPFLESGV
ncbi:MAG: hypothetical protein N2376_04820 [Clostridia bacterium]|nr:hypothetical protein [Clostridia bacterium]